MDSLQISWYLYTFEPYCSRVCALQYLSFPPSMDKEGGNFNPKGLEGTILKKAAFNQLQEVDRIFTQLKYLSKS